MAKAVAARMQGDDYQARWFWLKACDLLEPQTKVEKVVYEDQNVKSLDDVVVYYREGFQDSLGNQLCADYYQVKFHVTAEGSLTAKDLTEPRFINATKVSLLQRIRNAFTGLQNPEGVRFFLYTPWHVKHDDVLASVLSNHDGEILWDRLAKGGPNSATGKMRELWKDHLELSSDEELRRVTDRVRFHTGPALEELGRQLNCRLRAAGLKQVPEHTLSSPYDELIRKLLVNGATTMTATEIERICRSEGLWDGGPRVDTSRVSVGIRSFRRWAEDLQNRTEHFVCFADVFEGRSIRSATLWHTDIFPRLSDFLARTVQPGGRYLLHLDVHSSIAFLAGYLLPSKVNADIAVVQKTMAGNPEAWECPKTTATSDEDWEWQEESLSASAKGLALGVSLTHDVRPDVLDYVRQSLPGVGRLLFVSPRGGTSSLSVLSGAHAYCLAQSLVSKIDSMRGSASFEGPIQIFAAAPNGFMFFLGRLAQPIRRWVLHEYDFDTRALGAYTRSIEFPPPETVSRDKLARDIVLKED